MNTLSLIVGAAIRLSLVAGAAWAGQDGAKAPHVAVDTHWTIGQTAQPEPIVASIAQLFAQ